MPRDVELTHSTLPCEESASLSAAARRLTATRDATPGGCGALTALGRPVEGTVAAVRAGITPAGTTAIVTMSAWCEAEGGTPPALSLPAPGPPGVPAMPVPARGLPAMDSGGLGAGVPSDGGRPAPPPPTTLAPRMRASHAATSRRAMFEKSLDSAMGESSAMILNAALDMRTSSLSRTHSAVVSWWPPVMVHTAPTASPRPTSSSTRRLVRPVTGCALVCIRRRRPLMTTYKQVASSPWA
mmetsp:Transcript_16804/g.42060  ORF Transcript_16804/g.42060 Transcript_16804/m.42060 type:complete len:241 (-) Transcript_16804:860-1582(-)